MNFIAIIIIIILFPFHTRSNQIKLVQGEGAREEWGTRTSAGHEAMGDATERIGEGPNFRERPDVQGEGAREGVGTRTSAGHEATAHTGLTNFTT